MIFSCCSTVFSHPQGLKTRKCLRHLPCAGSSISPRSPPNISWYRTLVLSSPLSYFFLSCLVLTHLVLTLLLLAFLIQGHRLSDGYTFITVSRRNCQKAIWKPKNMLSRVMGGFCFSKIKIVAITSQPAGFKILSSWYPNCSYLILLHNTAMKAT